MTVYQTTVVIVGGGIGGLAAAIALRQAGIEAMIFEQAEELRPLGTGLLMAGSAMRALRSLGLDEAIRAAGGPQSFGGLRSWRGKLLLGVSGKDTTAVALHRAELQRILLDALPADAIRLGARCTAISQGPGGVQVHFADGSLARGAALVGADGLHSAVRDHLFGTTPPRYAGYTAWRGVVRFPHDRLMPGESWGAGARFGQVPISPELVYWFATANVPEAAPEGASGRKPTLLSRFSMWHAPIPALIAATPEDRILCTPIYDRPPLKRWSVGRATLLGDAAHPMTPNLGQGASQALVDATVLARCLQETRHVPVALRRYEAQRLRPTGTMVRQSRRVGQVGQWEHPLACALRNALLGMVPARVSL